MIKQESINSILEATDLEGVISEYVELQRKGTNMVGLCPFHDEKTGSFVFSPHKGTYHCFGCGQGGGSAAKFLQQVRNYTFPEAMEILASKAGIVLEYEKGNRDEIHKSYAESREKVKRLQAAFNEAHEIYLKASKPLQKWAGKIFSQEAIDAWQIINRSNTKLLSTRSNAKELQEIGLVNEGKNGLYDFFYNRILFPIHDDSGNPISYTARAKDEKSNPKYLNTANTDLYDKSVALYGYHINAKNIRKKGFAYLVEGPTDVIGLWDNEINNALASCGTAFTEHHAKKVARLTDHVIIVPDGDAAGHKSVLRKVELLVPLQVQISVLQMPAGKDPYDLIMEIGAKEWRKYSDSTKKEDGLAWVVRREKGKGTEYEKFAAINLAASLIDKIDSHILQEQYIKKTAAAIQVTKGTISDALKEIRNKSSKHSRSLSVEQEQQKLNYGLYYNKNRYYNSADEAISNYILKPLFLVRSENASRRVFEMVNEYGKSEFIDLDSDDFIKLPTFRSKTEMLGNFVFEGKDEIFMKLRKMVYLDMETIYSIEVLGYQPYNGCFAWSNGITDPDGKFHLVDEYGVVSYDDEKYFLPTFSRLRDYTRTPQGTADEFDINFFHPKDEKDIPVKCPKTLEQWASEFSVIFGDNASILICYYLASVYRDFIFSRYDFFPHLNLFGPPGSGKTYSARSITSMFGQPVRPVHAVTGSLSSFFRRPAQATNSITWYEEYSDKVQAEKVEGFKNMYDGFGRTLSKMDKSTKTKNTPVYSAILFSGQMLPVQDPALLERCITIFFDKVKATQKEIKRAEKFMDFAKAGYFARITSEVHGMRSYVVNHFDDRMEQVSQLIRDMFEDAERPDTRILHNFSIPMTIYSLVADRVKLPFTLAQIADVTYERIKDQVRAIKGVEETTQFWETIEWLIGHGRIAEEHYEVSAHDSITATDKDGDKHSIEFPEKKELLFMWFNYAYPEYRKGAAEQRIERVLPKDTLRNYLIKAPYYIGENIKRLGGKTQRCMIFDLSRMTQYNFSMPVSEKLTPSGGWSKPDEGMEPMPGDGPGLFDR